jgi:hypothetical protein
MVKKYFLSVVAAIVCVQFGGITIFGGENNQQSSVEDLQRIIQLPSTQFKKEAIEFAKELKPEIMDNGIVDELLNQFYKSVGYSDDSEQKSFIEKIIAEENGYTMKTYNRITNELENIFSRVQRIVVAKLNATQIREFLDAVALFRRILAKQLGQIKEKIEWKKIFQENLRIYRNIWHILFYRISFDPAYKKIKDDFRRLEKQISVQLFKASNLLSVRTHKIKRWCHSNKCSLRYVLGGFFVGSQKNRLQTFEQEAKTFKSLLAEVESLIKTSGFQNSFHISNGTVDKLVSKLPEEYEKFAEQWQFYLDRLGVDTFVNNWGTVFQPLQNSYFTQIRNSTQQFLENFYEKRKREFKLIEISMSIKVQ